jgi:hypothetical protein
MKELDLQFFIMWKPKGRETEWQNVSEERFYDIASEPGYSEYDYKIVYAGKEIFMKII